MLLAARCSLSQCVHDNIVATLIAKVVSVKMPAFILCALYALFYFYLFIYLFAVFFAATACRP